MISKTNRFHGLGSLKFLFRRGKQVRGNLMALRYNLNNRRSEYRLAVVVSKKVHKSAVVRNRIRRRVYEHVRQNYIIDQPYDLAILVYSELAATMPAEKLATEINNLFYKAGIKTKP